MVLRWLQYGVFTPRFVLHSWKPGEKSTMPWLYDDLMESVRRIFALRERLLPYLQSEYERKRKKFEPLIRPVFLTEPGYDCESDCFFCGDEILVCPVFDRGAVSVTLTLLRNKKGWKLRGEGDEIPGGASLTVPCLPTDEPVWFCPADEKTW